jgi:hypothetical protein
MARVLLVMARTAMVREYYFYKPYDGEEVYQPRLSRRIIELRRI